MFGDDLLRQRILRIEGFQLRQQALAQILGAHSDGIKILNDGDGIVQIILGIFSVLRQLFR